MGNKRRWVEFIPSISAGMQNGLTAIHLLLRTLCGVGWRGLQPALGSQYVFMFFPIKNAEAFFRGEVTDFDKVGVKAIDDYTLQVELNNPTPYFLQLMDHYSTFPVHRATIEKFGEAWESYTGWTRPQNIVSNGPF